MKIVTLGNGFVANHLPYEKITDRFLPKYLEDDLDHIFWNKKPDVIVNCLGRTGRPNVDSCENDKVNTYNANVVLPCLIADWCEKNNVHLIHLGSGCIYFGQSPNLDPNSSVVWHFGKGYLMARDLGWKETDFANPKSYYSKTKYACDLLLSQMPNVTTLRLRMPISSKNDQRNFINKIRGYKQVIDIPNSVTFMDDLVRCVDWAAKNSKFGVYHVINPQPITAAQVMREYQKYRPEHKFEVISEEELDKLTLAKRSNCILNTDKLNQDGFFMTPSEEALKNCMQSYINNI